MLTAQTRGCQSDWGRLGPGEPSTHTHLAWVGDTFPVFPGQQLGVTERPLYKQDWDGPLFSLRGKARLSQENPADPCPSPQENPRRVKSRTKRAGAHFHFLPRPPAPGGVQQGPDLGGWQVPPGQAAPRTRLHGGSARKQDGATPLPGGDRARSGGASVAGRDLGLAPPAPCRPWRYASGDITSRSGQHQRETHPASRRKSKWV